MEPRRIMTLHSIYARPNQQNQPSLYNEQVVAADEVEVLSGIIEASKGNTLEEGDVVYFASTSEIPRYKFREYAKDKNMARCISVEKSTAVALGTNPISSLLTRKPETYYMVTAPTLANLINCQMSYFDGRPNVIYVSKLVATQHKQLHTLLNNYPSERYISYWGLDRQLKNFAKLWPELEQIVTMKKKVVLDDTINKTINKGIILNDEMLEQIREMFRSKDVKNHTTAMEIMANSDYEACELQLVLLLNEFQGTITSNPYFNLVNFKNFRRFFDKYPWASHYESFINHLVGDLIKKGTLPDDLREDVRKFALRRANSHKYANAPYKITEIKFNDEL